MQISRATFISVKAFVILGCLGLLSFAAGQTQQSRGKIGVLPFTNSSINQLQLEGLRADFIQLLQKRGIDAVPLKQDNLKKARLEAQQLGCQYILDTDVNAMTPGESRSSPVAAQIYHGHEGASGSAGFRLIDAADGKGMYRKTVTTEGAISSSEAAFNAIWLETEALITELHTLQAH